MPEWNTFVKTYCLEPEHLPNPHGSNIVVIEGLDSEEYNGADGKPQVRHRLWLAGWDVPLRLNNTRIKVLQTILGPRTEDAIGRKIVLTVVAQNNYGEFKAAINIHPFAPQPDSPVTPVPARLATRSPLRLASAATYGVTVAPAAFTLPPGSAQPGNTMPGPAPGLPTPHAMPAAGGGGGAVRPSGQKLGNEFAAKLIVELRKRNWTWDRLVAHFRQHGMAALVAAELPPDCDAALRTPAWAILKTQPMTVAVDEAATIQQLIASWTPPPTPTPPAPTAPAGPSVPKSGEIVDPVSGEVIPTDDIPF